MFAFWPSENQCAYATCVFEGNLTNTILTELYQTLLSFGERFPAMKEAIYKIDAIHSAF
jgi:hypothetical protein